MNPFLQALLAEMPPAFHAVITFICTIAVATYQLGVVMMDTLAEVWHEFVADFSWYAKVAYNYGSKAVSHVAVARNNNFPGHNIILNTACTTLPIIFTVVAMTVPTFIGLCYYCILPFFRIVFQTRRIHAIFIRIFVRQGSPRYTRWLLQQGGLSNHHLCTCLYTSLVNTQHANVGYVYCMYHQLIPTDTISRAGRWPGSVPLPTAILPHQQMYDLPARNANIAAIVNQFCGVIAVRQALAGRNLTKFELLAALFDFFETSIPTSCTGTPTAYYRCTCKYNNYHCALTEILTIYPFPITRWYAQELHVTIKVLRTQYADNNNGHHTRVIPLGP